MRENGAEEARGMTTTQQPTDDPEVDHEVMRRFGARTGLWVPLIARGRTIGLLAA